MSRGPPHRYNSSGERLRGYPPRYGVEFSGYYVGPPYKRQRRHSSDDEMAPYGPAFYDPPFVRHQEVGLGEFNDFSSVSVEKDLKIHERDGSRRDFERSESHSKKRQSSTEGSEHSSQQQSTSAPMSPHSSKVSPGFSPRQQSPRARPVSPPSSTSSATTQPLLIVTSQSTSSSKVPSVSSSDDGVLASKQQPLLTVCSTTSQSVQGYGPVLGNKLKDGTGRPTLISSLSPHEGLQRKESYSGPTVEAISPSAPASESGMDNGGESKKEIKDEQSDMMSKDELLQGMEKVDREIAQVKQQINNLKKMQKQLEDEASKQQDEPKKEEIPAPEVKPKSVVQIIYEENRKKAEAAQARLAKLGVPLPGGKPLYNQPSDLPCYHENLRKAPAVKAKLVKYFQLRKQAKEIKNRQLCKEYKTLKQAWLKKIERHENNPKRKQKEAKLREFYEKVFPEIKKQREQTERFTRMGSRSNWGIVARSEAEFNEIVDNLNEQEANERHMRTLAVEPPPMLDKEERRLKFINRNGLIRDPLATLNERKHRNIWTEKERQIFKDKFVHNPKDFDLISSFLPGKSVADCILFYYQTKKKEHYKQLSRRLNLKKRRRDQFAAGREGAPSNKIRAGASESSAKGDRGGSEGDEELEEMTDSAEESEENEDNPPPPVTTPQVATPTQSAKRADHVETSRWSEKEIEIALQGLRECGRDWEAIARRVVTKTGAQCKNFYFNYKKKLRLEDLIAEYDKTKIQRVQQQQKQQREQHQQRQHHNPPQQQQQQQQQPQQKDVPSAEDKQEPTPKSGPGAQQSDTSHPNQSNAKSNSVVTSNVPVINSRDSTPGTTANSVASPANVPTTSTTSSMSSLQLGSSRIVRSQSPRLPLSSSSSTLFMPTPGVIASIGRASPNVGTTHQGQGFYQPLLIESMKQDMQHSSRTLHPESIHTGLVYPRAVDSSHPRHGPLVSSHPAHSNSDSQSLFEGSSVLKQLPHSTTSHHSSSNIVLSSKEAPLPGFSYAVTSNPETSHVTSSNLGSSQGGTSHPGTSHPPIPQQGVPHTLTPHPGISHAGGPHSASSILFTSSGPAHSHRSRPRSHSPVIVTPQDKPHSQVTFLKEGTVGHPSSHKSLPLSSYPGNLRGEPVSRIIMKTEDVRRVSPEMHKKPTDVIVIDGDEQKKIVEGYPRLETAEGNQASSMLRRLASAGNEHVVTATEPMRPQSLPLSSDTRLMSHTESRTQRSATPPSNSLAARQQVLNPPPPLIQMSSSRDKKYITAQDMAPESSRHREGSVHGDRNQDRYLHHSQEATPVRDASRHTHTPIDNRVSEKERRTPVVETVDLTKDREVDTSSLKRPPSRSHITLGSSSARATLQALAISASSENKSTDATEKIAQNKREENYLPLRAPDTKLSVYEQNEAIRKFALSNVCVSVPREFATGSDYPTQPYSLMALQAQHQAHVHPHPAGTSTPPPYGYPFHPSISHPMTSFHHHPDRPFLMPVVQHVPPHSVNGEELPSHFKVSGTYAPHYPQGVGYFPAGIRYQPMTVCGLRHPVPVSEERRAMPHPLEVPTRRENDISEQELAHPFLVRQSRHMHAPGVTERLSPGELPTISRPSRSPHEPVQRPQTIPPDTKPHVAQKTEAAKAVSPPAVTYLSRIPSRPASVSEMRNRAAVIPDLKDTEALSQTFPEPQPVIVPDSKHSNREDVGRRTEPSDNRDTKEPTKESKESTLAKVFPMSAFDTLVDVAAAARKVDIPSCAKEEHEGPASPGEASVKKEKSLWQETRGPHARFTGHGMTSPPRLSSPPNPTSVSPGMSGGPRYGISTGLVPKPPPLMPITGVRSIPEGNSSSSISLSVSGGGHTTTPASRSASKLTSPPGTKVKLSVSPDGPPPLISTSVISPTGSSHGASPNEPPPLIRGPPLLRSPEKEADSSVKTKVNPDTLPKRRPDKETSISKSSYHEDERTSYIDPDFQRKFWMNLNESVQLHSQKAHGDAQNTSSTPRQLGHSQVRTIVATREYLESFHPSSVTGPEQFQPLPSSTSAVERKEATSVREVQRSWISNENSRDVHRSNPPMQSRHAHGQGEKRDERSHENWQVNNKTFPFAQKPVISYGGATTSSPQLKAPPDATTSYASGSETEEGEEEVDIETSVQPSSVGLHPRVLALARNSQRTTQTYDASDSETLSAEESEHLPESSDEMFAITTTKVYTQADGGHEERNESVLEGIDNTTFVDTCDADADTNTSLPSTSKDYSDVEDEHTEGSLEEKGLQKSDVLRVFTSPISPELPVSINDQQTEDIPTTSASPEESRQQGEKPQELLETEGEIDVTLDRQNSEETVEVSDHELTPSHVSSPNEPSLEEDSSEALPVSVDEGVELMDVVRVQSSEHSLVGSSETDIGSTHPQVVSSHQQVSEDSPDSSANTMATSDENVTSSLEENVHDRDANLTDVVTSVGMDDMRTAEQSLNEEQSALVTAATDADSCPSTSEATRSNTVSPLVNPSERDEAINEAETLENPGSEDGFPNAPDTFSTLSESHPPEVSSAMDDVSDDEGHSTYPTFVGEFVPLPGEVDSPDIKSGCSTNIASEASSIGDDRISERELIDVAEPTASNREEPSGVLSPDESARHSDDTLSEGEIPSSLESSHSEDELPSLEKKSGNNEAAVLSGGEPSEESRSNLLPDTSQIVIDRDQLPSQSSETVGDEQLSEGEIPESEEEATVETPQGSLASVGEADSTPLPSRRASVVSSSQEATLSSDCYINMIPISPAPPESPNHQSKCDGTSLLPQWPSIDSQYSSLMSLPLTSRINPFPYSTLSFNVGSANSSARSSPVPQALAVSLTSGSSPSSSSLLPRPQEPTPLLSDNYEPLSDDDDNGVVDTSNISEDSP